MILELKYYGFIKLSSLIYKNDKLLFDYLYIKRYKYKNKKYIHLKMYIIILWPLKRSKNILYN